MVVNILAVGHCLVRINTNIFTRKPTLLASLKIIKQTCPQTTAQCTEECLSLSTWLI